MIDQGLETLAGKRVVYCKLNQTSFKHRAEMQAAEGNSETIPYRSHFIGGSGKLASYEDQRELRKAIENGTQYRLGSRLLSVVTPDAVYKDISGFGTLQRARLALEKWKELGYKGSPSSAASFFRKHFEFRRWTTEGAGKQRLTPYWANSLLRKHVHGGWMELRKYGHNYGPLYHYDINSAYLWAGMKGVPKKVRPYKKGDKHYVALMEVESLGEATNCWPNVMYRHRECCLVTSEDVREMGITGRIILGISWEEGDTVNLADWLLSLDVPAELWKRLTQSYWGIFFCRTNLEARKMKEGKVVKEWPQRPRTQNLVWAALIIRRVMRKVWRQMNDRNGVLCYVDSVLLPEPIETGTEAGEWKLENEYEKGIYAIAPGVWDTLPVTDRNNIHKWHRHAGHAAPEHVYKHQEREGLAMALA